MSGGENEGNRLPTDTHPRDFTLYKEQIKKETLPQRLPTTLLVDGIPESLSEDRVRTELMRFLKTEFNAHATEIARINYFTGIAVYRLVLTTPHEADSLAGKRAQLPIGSKTYTVFLVRPPIWKAESKESKSKSEQKASKKRSSAVIVEDSDEDITPAKRRKREDLRPVSLPSTPSRFAEKRLGESEATPATSVAAKFAALEAAIENLSRIVQEMKAKEAQQSAGDNTKVKRVIGAKKVDGKLFMLVEWEDCQPSFVAADILRKEAPNKVIDFYEARVRFHGSKGDSAEDGSSSD